MQTKFIYASPPGSNSPPGDWFFEKRSLGEILDFLVATDLSRKSILGFVLGEGLEDSEIRRFFEELVNQNGLPSGVYSKLEISDWCKGCKLFAGEPEESGGGDALEYSLIYGILGLTTNKYKKWRQSWPTRLKGVPAKKKARNREFKKLLYESAFFQRDVRLVELLKKGMSTFNGNQEKQGIIPTASSVPDKVTIENYFQRLFKEVLPAQRPLLQTIEISFLTQSKIQLKLLAKIKTLEVEQRKNLNLLKELVNYKNKMEEEKAAKESRRQKRLKRQKRQQSPPFLREYLPWVLAFLEKKKWNNLTKSRLRLAMVLLVVTGVRISEIRFIKVSQIVTLFEKGYLRVNLSKGGHKIFLTKEGQTLVSTYRFDFMNLMFLLGFLQELPTRRNLGNLEPAVLEFYLFSANSSKGQTPLSRSFFTRQMNEVLTQTPELLERGIQLTSHSFRRGYITALWKETKDLEFVRQVIAHKQIGTTSLYVKVLSDEERQRRYLAKRDLELLEKFKAQQVNTKGEENPDEKSGGRWVL